MGEHEAGSLGVRGSTPLSSTTFGSGRRARRRAACRFAVFAAGALVAALLLDSSAAAQGARRKVPRVGILLPGTRPSGPSPFEEGLRELGYVEGRSIRFERRYAEWRPERLAELARELVRLRVDVILATNLQTADAVKQATARIPIVMIAGSDPVARGLVASLERPGGNVTGLSLTTAEVVGKQVGLVKEVLPALARLGVLWDASLGPFVLAREARLQAWARDLELVPLEVRDAADLGAVVATATDARVGAVTLVESPMFWTHRRRLGELGVKSQLPLVAMSREFAEAGFLLAYGPSSAALWRQAAALVDRILKGARPGELAIEHPRRYDLVVNSRTARALGLTLPPALLARAGTVLP